jgi:hypothetical protein
MQSSVGDVFPQASTNVRCATVRMNCPVCMSLATEQRSARHVFITGSRTDAGHMVDEVNASNDVYQLLSVHDQTNAAAAQQIASDGHFGVTGEGAVVVISELVDVGTLRSVAKGSFQQLGFVDDTNDGVSLNHRGSSSGQ